MKNLIAVVLAVLAAICIAPANAVEQPTTPLRIGLTPTFPNDQYRALEEWRRYLEQRLQRKVEFIRRDSYIEAMDLLRLQKVDFAWICDYPFVFFKDQVKLLAVPLYHGRPYYQSYLIVPAKDSQTTSIAQLKNRVFAYADPYSNTGYLTPRFELQQLGENPARFFSKTFFTWGHRKTVEAVAAGLAQGGAVSSHVWDTLAKVKPELTAATRIVSRSPEFGFPPFVARASISDAEFHDMQRALLAMSEDELGRRLLEGLNLDGFVAGDPRFYDRVDQMIRAYGKP
jgi:phosphonate transport system substrate-binding protein